MLSVFMLAWLSLLAAAFHTSRPDPDKLLFWTVEMVLVLAGLVEAGYVERGDPVTRLRRAVRVFAVLVFFVYMASCVFKLASPV
jgi:hypothetical protein